MPAAQNPATSNDSRPAECGVASMSVGRHAGAGAPTSMRGVAGVCGLAGACGRMRAGGRMQAQARGTPAGGCTNAGILTGAGRAVGVGAAAAVNALLAGPQERSRAGGANGAIGQGVVGQTREEEREIPVSEKELQFQSF